MGRILRAPQIILFSPFSANKSNEYPNIEFLYDDNQPLKNRAVITDNTTNEIIYDITEQSMNLYHELRYIKKPGGIEPVFENGHQYLVQIQVFDAEGNSSNLFDCQPVLFYCYSTPLFTFEGNLPDVYRQANITLNIRYNQLEGEKLRDVQFFEYDYNRVLLNQSNIIYSSTPSYTFNRLENDKTYYFRAIGETERGIKLDTGYREVDVVYNTVPTNVTLQLENKKCDGYIQIISNIVDIDYRLENDNYILEDGMLTLIDNSITYYDGFEITGDFILYVEAKKLPLKTFLTTNNDIFSLEIVEVCGVYYCHLIIKNSCVSQYVPLAKAKLYTDGNKYVEFIDANNENDLVIFEVKRKNGIYGLKVYYRTEIES